VLGLVTVLKAIVEQIKLLTSQIRGAIDAHPDGQIFRSLFRDPRSVVTAAELVAEIGDRRERYDTRARLEARAGHCPVAIESGKKKVASFRWACNKTLRDAVAVLADNSRKHNPWAQKIYADAIARGCNHPHAIRILGRAWLRIIWRLWHDHTAYDPSRHGSLNRLLAVQG
jgi:transposase